MCLARDVPGRFDACSCRGEVALDVDLARCGQLFERNRSRSPLWRGSVEVRGVGRGRVRGRRRRRYLLGRELVVVETPLRQLGHREGASLRVVGRFFGERREPSCGLLGARRRLVLDRTGARTVGHTVVGAGRRVGDGGPQIRRAEIARIGGRAEGRHARRLRRARRRRDRLASSKERSEPATSLFSAGWLGPRHTWLDRHGHRRLRRGRGLRRLRWRGGSGRPLVLPFALVGVVARGNDDSLLPLVERRVPVDVGKIGQLLVAHAEASRPRRRRMSK